jgi:antirestriction protein ArdC
MEPTTKTRDVFALVTDRIIEHLENGTIPWQRPWSSSGLPRNLVSGKAYRGINVWLLNALEYEQNLFLTFKQVKELGGSVRAGEKSHSVIFWKWPEEDTETGKKKIPILRYYFVVNISQCTGIPEQYLPAPVLKRKNDPIEVCQEIVQRMPHGPEIRHQGDKAYYHPFFDFVNMPSMERFINSESYYSTLFHELVHSTGHESRLKRKELQTSTTTDFDAYSLEELTAEIGACYLNSYAGIVGWDFTNHVAYIQGWLEKLRNDKRCIVYASTQAQKAMDYILDSCNRYTEEDFTEAVYLQHETEADE